MFLYMKHKMILKMFKFKYAFAKEMWNKSNPKQTCIEWVQLKINLDFLLLVELYQKDAVLDISFPAWQLASR